MNTIYGPKPVISDTQVFECFYRAMVSDCRDSFALDGYTASMAHDDRRYLERRLDREGSPFALALMPELGRALNLALCTGNPYVVPSPRWSVMNDGLPRLFHRIWLIALRPEDACDDSGQVPDSRKRALAIRFLRQVTLVWSKVETEPSTQQVDEAVKAFVDRVACPGRICHLLYEDEYANDIIQYASLEADRLMSGWSVTGPHLPTDPRSRQLNDGCFGQHGPGAVSEGVPSGDKWTFLHRIDDDELLQSGSFCLWGPKGHHSNSFSRLIAVPKDERGPRLIAAEPAAMMFAQQGLGRALMHYIEKESPARGRINFTDQTVNGNISKDLAYATLDLKDASDLVHIEHIELLFMDQSVLLQRLLNRRSKVCRLPNGNDILPQCYATMGNALCFPIESIVFYCLVCGILRANGVYKRDVFVYGDDIIVRRELAEKVIDGLTRVGLRVNNTKCCYKTPFRESCGFEWWDGYPVTVVRPKIVGVSGPHAVARWSMYLQSFVDYGYLETAESIAVLLSSCFTVPPVFVGGYPLKGTSYITRWNSDLQRLEYKTLCVVERTERCELPGEYGLYRYFTGGLSQPVVTADPNGRVPRQKLVTRITWVPAS